MKIYQVAGCPFAHRARIVLEEKKLRYDVIYFERRNRPAELAAISPDARSPTLFDDDGNTVWDSLVVIEYLDERYSDAALMPRDAAGRARARLLMREAESKLLPAMGPIVEEVVYKAEGPRDESKVEKGLSQFRSALVPWQARLEHQAFLLGDTLTLADITLFTPIFAMARLLGENGNIPSALTGLRAWYDRIAARPSTAY